MTASSQVSEEIGTTRLARSGNPVRGQRRKMLQTLAGAIIAPLCPLSLMGPSLKSCCNDSAQSAVPAGSQAPRGGRTTIITSIHLKRRNWESNGTDTDITQDGRFTVYAHALGVTRKVREGSLDQKALDNLVSIISKAEVFRLPDEYKSVPQRQFSWWGFELTVKADARSKTIRYTSDNKDVPQKIRDIVTTVMDLTK